MTASPCPTPERKQERALDEESGVVPGVASGFLDTVGPILSFSEPDFAREFR